MCASFCQEGFQHRGLWGGWHTYYGMVPPPFLTPEEPFCACVVREASLTSRMRNTWSLYLLSKQDSAPPCSCHYLYLGVSVHRGQIPAAQPGAHPSPASLALMSSNSHNRSSDHGGYALQQRGFSLIFGWVSWCKTRWKVEEILWLIKPRKHHSLHLLDVSDK